MFSTRAAGSLAAPASEAASAGARVSADLAAVNKPRRLSEEALIDALFKSYKH